MNSLPRNGESARWRNTSCHVSVGTQCGREWVKYKSDGGTGSPIAFNNVKISSF